MLLWLLAFAPVVGVAVTAILAANATQSARDVEDAAPRGELDRMAPAWWFVWVVTWGQVSLVAFVFLRAAYPAPG